MEVTTINTAQQKQQQTNNNSTNTSHQFISNDNLQSQPQTTTKSTIILNELPQPPTTITVSTDIKITNKVGSSLNNIKINNNGNQPIVDGRDNGDALMTLHQSSDQDVRSNTRRDCNMDLNHNENFNRQLKSDVEFIIAALLDRVEADKEAKQNCNERKSTEPPISYTNGPKQGVVESTACVPISVGSQPKVSIVTPVGPDEVDDDDKPKDIVTLRNLEITPPPPPPPQTIVEGSPQDITTADDMPKRTRSRSISGKRKHSESTEPGDEVEGGRSKRQRRQTKLFQVVESNKTSIKSEKPLATPKRQKTSTTGRTSTVRKKQPKEEQPQKTLPQVQVNYDQQDVIFYEKNDYLAIRNEENSFYLCQLAENVRVLRPLIKIRWLDTKDDGKTYFLTSHYDKVPQKSILMPVILTKLKSTKKSEQLFTLDDQHKDNIMERLRRSLNVTSESV